MPHYKDPENKLHFIDSAEFAHLLPAGCVAITDAEAEALRPVPQPDPVAEARAYLIETDWYVVRFAETGVAIPEEVLAKRAAARLIL